MTISDVTEQAAFSAAEPPAPEPSAPSFDGNALLSAIRAMVDEVRDDLSGQIAAVDARVTAAEQKVPQFRQAEPRTFGNDEFDRYAPNDPNDILGLIPSDGNVHSGEKRRIQVGSNGLRANADEPRFGVGSRVLLNLDARPHGADRTWGELIQEKNVPRGLGIVQNWCFYNRTDGWKYHVKFPNKCTPGSPNGVVAVYESELVPA